MFPIAFHLGDVTITWYGVLVAAGFLIAVRRAIVAARRDGLSGQMVERLAFWMIVAAVIGSRLAYVLTDLETYLANPALVVNPREGGLVFLGGLVAAVGVAALYVRHRGVSLARYADVMLPTVALGHAFGRVGCFAVGCCYGREAAGLPWAVRFPTSPWEQIAPVGVPLHPVQLYEAVVNLAIFASLTWWWHPRRRFDGQVGLLYLILYSVSRVVLELFRGDEARGFLFEPWLGTLVSTSQATSVVLGLGAVAGYAWMLRGRAARD